MREWLSLKTVRLLASIAAALGAICLAIAVTFLVPLVSNQEKRIRHQDVELECRGDLAAEVDVVRSEITLHLSRGLRDLALGDEPGLAREIAILGDLDHELEVASERRARTIELCSEVAG